MPLARYFLFVGGVLLALLFISDAFLAKLPDANRANPDLPIIRIHSVQKWPERVVYNTNLPTIIPPHVANTNSVPVTIAEVSSKPRVREAFAQLQPSDVNPQQAPDTRRREPMLQRKRKIAKRRAPLPMVQLAQRPQFGFIGRSIW